VAVDLLRLMEMSEEYSGVVCFGSRKSDWDLSLRRQTGCLNVRVDVLGWSSDPA
jgi:hypothetical protein